MYPWDRPATPEEIAEGDALFEAGWRGVSTRYRTVALFEQEGFQKWLEKNHNHKKRLEENADHPHFDQILECAKDSYLRSNASPNKSLEHHVFRQVKRRENNWDPGVLAMIQKVFNPKTTAEELRQMFPGKAKSTQD